MTGRKRDFLSTGENFSTPSSQLLFGERKKRCIVGSAEAHISIPRMNKGPLSSSSFPSTMSSLSLSSIDSAAVTIESRRQKKEWRKTFISIFLSSSFLSNSDAGGGGSSSASASSLPSSSGAPSHSSSSSSSLSSRRRDYRSRVENAEGVIKRLKAYYEVGRGENEWADDYWAGNDGGACMHAQNGQTH